MPLRLGILLCVATARAAPAPAVADELSAIKPKPRQTTFTSVPSVLPGSSDGTCKWDGCGAPATPNEDCGWGSGNKMPEGPQPGKPVGCTYCRGGQCYYKKAPGALCGSNNECQNNDCSKGHCVLPNGKTCSSDGIFIREDSCMCPEFEDMCESCMCDGGESYCNAECRNNAVALANFYYIFDIPQLPPTGGPSSCCVPRLPVGWPCAHKWQCASFSCSKASLFLGYFCKE